MTDKITRGRGFILGRPIDDDDPIVRDGERIRCSAVFMDAASRELAERAQAAIDEVSTDAVEAAYEKMCDDLQYRWQTPPSRPATTVDTRTAAGNSLTREEAYDKFCLDLSNAHLHRR